MKISVPVFVLLLIAVTVSVLGLAGAWAWVWVSYLFTPASLRISAYLTLIFAVSSLVFAWLLVVVEPPRRDWM